VLFFGRCAVEWAMLGRNGGGWDDGNMARKEEMRGIEGVLLSRGVIEVSQDRVAGVKRCAQVPRTSSRKVRDDP
jgi:hypothetical protein